MNFEQPKNFGEPSPEEEFASNPRTFIYKHVKNAIEAHLKSGASIGEAVKIEIDYFTEVIKKSETPGNVLDPHSREEAENGLQEAIKDMLAEHSPEIEETGKMSEDERATREMVVRLAESGTIASLPPHETIDVVKTLMHRHKNKVDDATFNKMMEWASDELSRHFGEIVFEKSVEAKSEKPTTGEKSAINVDASQIFNPAYISSLFHEGSLKGVSASELWLKIKTVIDKTPKEKQGGVYKSALAGAGMTLLGSFLEGLFKK